ncbi:MAG: iron-containing alcohol dehydrogenase, partial [Bdellovibrionota bacterium]
SPHVFPSFSVLDPTVTFSLPVKQVANGIIDAFVHVTEQYLTYPVNAMIQDQFAEGILRTLITEGPKTLQNPTDYDARANFMWAATMALNGLIGVGVPQDWATHMIGHELTAMFGIDHGRTLAVVYPALMRILSAEKKEKLLQYADRVWNIKAGAEEARIAQTISKTEAFFQSLGVPTRLREYNVSKSDIPAVLESLSGHEMTCLGEHGNVTLELSEKILNDCF